MKQFIKRSVVVFANLTFAVRGLKFPSYFDNSDRIQLLLHGIEPDVINAAQLYVKRGMTVFDIGANVGLMTRVFAHATGESGKVIAFEPDPTTMEYLRYNVKSIAHVEVASKAISNENTIAKFHLNPRSGTSNSLIENKAAKTSIDVECTTLDSYLETNPHLIPDFIKIDVEGAEPKVFAGMKETLKRFPKILVVAEFCPGNLMNSKCSTREFYDMLTNLELKIAILNARGLPTDVPNYETLIQQMGSKEYVNLICVRS